MHSTQKSSHPIYHPEGARGHPFDSVVTIQVSLLCSPLLSPPNRTPLEVPTANQNYDFVQKLKKSVKNPSKNPSKIPSKIPSNNLSKICQKICQKIRHKIRQKSIKKIQPPNISHQGSSWSPI